jgi:hypothetical protein
MMASKSYMKGSDVFYFNADTFIKLMSDLEETERILISDPGKINDPIELKRMADRVGHAIAHCEQLGLSSALKQVRRIKDRVLTGTCMASELKGLMVEFRTRILEDCESKVFFSVTDSRIIDEFFKPSVQDDPIQHLTQKRADEIFDIATVKRFPGATQDIDEAARCFVCARYPACMFQPNACG